MNHLKHIKLFENFRYIKESINFDRIMTDWRRVGLDKIQTCLYHLKSQPLLDVHLKISSFWPSADVKPMSNDLVYAIL